MLAWRAARARSALAILPATAAAAGRRCMHSTVANRAGDAPSDGSDMRPGMRSNVHFRLTPQKHPLNIDKAIDENIWPNPMAHPVWSKEALAAIAQTHVEPRTKVDERAYRAVQTLRYLFDLFSGWRYGELTSKKVILRCIFLETVAGVPGMCAAMVRHLRSLRRLQRDHGWIHTLLEEAENERMHLLTFLQLRQPGTIFRSMVVLGQGVFLGSFSLAYFISPVFCHRLVGYIEEEAVSTYTKILKALDDGKLPDLANKPAPAIALSYWHLPVGASMRDVFEVVRADETNHRDVNHTFAQLQASQDNPYVVKQNGY